ncbi:MAG TPA: LysR substrate-binding domain-containing protein [Hyphomonas sp.]|uniref:LysR family transcriptional regulator n=1 Tax=Thauera sp. 28 TaxID=303682 RepID=UPI0002CE2E34|nr:LysR family transcriptional regulator [Thauera sp. 28]ENO93923.1 transcriptional regulator [Thauera sp. 28]HAY05467.1 LysR family transcriptional regulator [Hyphomonas sp.]HRJ02700.1 LysR substrate-binding domain-containing protein [Hyphomonas sp.]
MKIELRQIRQFLAVADTLNFRRAAEHLALAQPALSRGIQLLEHQLGVSLFKRNNRRVELTPAGTVFLKGCQDLMEDLDETVRQARKAQRGELGTLSIGYTDFAISGVLPRILDGFRRKYPEIDIELTYGSTHQQLEDLAIRKIDVAFVTSPVAGANLALIPVQHDRYVAVLPAAHPLARQATVDISELAGEGFIVGVMARWRHFRRHLDALCLKAGFAPRIVQEVYNTEGMFGLISANIGVTIHLECTANYIRSDVALRPLTGVDDTIITVAAWREDDMRPALTHFADFLQTLPRNADHGLL